MINNFKENKINYRLDLTYMLYTLKSTVIEMRFVINIFENGIYSSVLSRFQSPYKFFLTYHNLGHFFCHILFQCIEYVIGRPKGS